MVDVTIPRCLANHAIIRLSVAVNRNANYLKQVRIYKRSSRENTIFLAQAKRNAFVKIVRIRHHLISIVPIENVHISR